MEFSEKANWVRPYALAGIGDVQLGHRDALSWICEAQ
jgi:hypothetical protein